MLVVWPAAFWHEVTTVHEVCAEHGELLDVGPVGAAPADGEHAPLLSASSDEAAHEPCPFLTLAQPSSAAPEARAAGEPMFARPALAVLPSAERQLSVPILSLAPKHSPPALA